MPLSDPIRFHLDESCDPRLAPGLRLRGIEVTTSQEVGLLGSPDEEQLAHAHAEGRPLVTHDGDFVAIHKSGVDHSGIIYCHQRRQMKFTTRAYMILILHKWLLRGMKWASAFFRAMIIAIE